MVRQKNKVFSSEFNKGVCLVYVGRAIMSALCGGNIWVFVYYIIHWSTTSRRLQHKRICVVCNVCRIFVPLLLTMKKNRATMHQAGCPESERRRLPEKPTIQQFLLLVMNYAKPSYDYVKHWCNIAEDLLFNELSHWDFYQPELGINGKSVLLMTCLKHASSGFSKVFLHFRRQINIFFFACGHFDYYW